MQYNGMAFNSHDIANSNVYKKVINKVETIALELKTLQL